MPKNMHVVANLEQTCCMLVEENKSRFSAPSNRLIERSGKDCLKLVARLITGSDLLQVVSTSLILLG